jgi:hypothetical protein
MDHARVVECGLDVGRIASRALERGYRGEDAFVALVAMLERRIAMELEPEPGDAGPRPACRAGCAACCTVNVATLAVEGIAVAAFLRGLLRPAEIAPRADALLAFHERVRWCDDAERIHLGLACPFVDERGACIVHPVRPLACRAVTSLDPADCRRALAERAGDDGDGTVRMNLLQRALYDESLQALAAALSERGLDARTRDVSGMVGVFLADESRAGAWLSGTPLPLE